jgi:hypothetical protein
MNLKKIIREEIDDIKWVEDVKPKPTHKTPEWKELKSGDMVKVVDPDSLAYGQNLTVHKLMHDVGYENKGGAFTTVEYDTLYFAGDEVEWLSTYDWMGLDESDEMDWIREIPAGFELKQNRRYIIDCCETGYDENIFLNKFIELFGDIPPYNKYLNIAGTSPPSSLVNWFNNGYIKEQNHRVSLLLKMPGMPRHSEIGGWLRCVDKKYGLITIRITPQHFFNGVIDWDSDI